MIQHIILSCECTYYSMQKRNLRVVNNNVSVGTRNIGVSILEKKWEYSLFSVQLVPSPFHVSIDRRLDLLIAANSVEGWMSSELESSVPLTSQFTKQNTCAYCTLRNCLIHIFFSTMMELCGNATIEVTYFNYNIKGREPCYLS